MINNKETINIDGKNYIIEDLSDEARYYVGQLQDLMQQKTLTHNKLHQIDMSINGFNQALREELAKEEESS